MEIARQETIEEKAQTKLITHIWYDGVEVEYNDTEKDYIKISKD
jgi:hypothetical protein